MTNKLAHYRLLSLSNKNKSKREIVKFDKIKSVGIVYNASDKQHIQMIEIYAKALESKGINVITLGYIPLKKIPDHIQPHYKTDYYCKKQLDWTKVPKKSDINRFTNEKFDYLFNVYSIAQPELLGISTLSMAKCRIGLYFKNFEFAMDVMIDQVSNNLETILELFTKQIKKF